MTADRNRTSTLRVPALARVEGEGGFFVRLRGGRVTEARLDIYEPPRFFEAFLRGRSYLEPPDVTARICGICPVAYQVSSCNALEAGLGLAVSEEIVALRRLLYCAEWIQSHALHIHLLHAPDFLGFDSVLEMAREAPAAVRRGLRLKRVGNDLMDVIGGRSVHPVNLRVGGFYRAPRKEDLAALEPALEQAVEDAEETLRWVAGFPFPELEVDCELVALRNRDRYPLEDGFLVSSEGLELPPDRYEEVFEEVQVPHSTALHARVRGRGTYLVGPLARYTLNADLLTERSRVAAEEAGLGPSCRNPFRSIVVRAVETLYACEEALRLVRAYRPPAPPFHPTSPSAFRGTGWSEAPRGLLYHRYTVASDGAIEDALIVPPTSQNMASVEADLRAFVESHQDLPRADLQWQCEQVIRNYDPCISCSTHFLRLDLETG